MIYKIFRVLAIDLYASHLVNATCKHDWITSSFSVYVIRMFFTCVCLVDMISGQTMGSLELYALFFIQLRLLLESIIWLWAIWRIPCFSLLILTELTFYLWNHTKAPICKARVCRWIWQSTITYCRRAYCAYVCYYYDYYLLMSKLVVLERALGYKQFYPMGSPKVPQNRLFAQCFFPPGTR